MRGNKWSCYLPIDRSIVLIVVLALQGCLPSRKNTSSNLLAPTTDVGIAWAKTSVNAVSFRKNSLVTDGDEQFIAFYDTLGRVVVGKRKLIARDWTPSTTQFKGNAADAHNCISIMVDGDGYLHLAWDHHNNRLHYAVSTKPYGLEFEQRQMTGLHENKVTYPEFYRLPDGDILFQYRDGGSGNGNLVLNKYSIAAKQWTQVQTNLIDGEGQRNAYCQTAVDKKGTIHISWVWRETPDVASNHDMCYACSKDGGKTWLKSTGEVYDLPITAPKAEYIMRIPQHSELMNQTSMYANDKGIPFIATYWRDALDTVPQFRVIYREGNSWKQINTGFRKTAFSLSGFGTRSIPISRPQVVSYTAGKHNDIILLFRDRERGNKVSLAVFDRNKPSKGWQLSDLTTDAVDAWEPTFDTELWKNKNILSVFVQKVSQTNGEGQAKMQGQLIRAIHWQPGGR